MHGIIIGGEKLKFSASHFIVEHNKCERLHGHNYCVKAELYGDVDEKGMLIDFNEIKGIVKKICDFLDHKVIIPKDSVHIKISGDKENIEVIAGRKKYSFPKSDCAVIESESTTAEKLAEYIFKKIEAELEKKKRNIRVKRVIVSESIGSEAFYER